MSTLLNNQSNRGLKSGFTLVEASISIFIIIVGLMAVAQFYPFSLRIINDSGNTTTAANIATEKLEEVASLHYDDLATGTIELKHRLSDDQNNFLYRYQRETVVETVDQNLQASGSDIGFKKITVTVFWNSPVKLKERSIQISSLASDY